MSFLKKLGSGLKKFGTGAAHALGISANMTPMGAIGSIATTGLINYIGTRYADARRNKLNRQMAEYEYKKNLQSWKMQNEYNTPEQQMQRFRDAGLNPNLIYGQGTPGNAQGIAQYNAPDLDFSAVSPLNIVDMVTTYNDTRQKQADTALTQERFETQKHTTAIELARVVVAEKDSALAKIEREIAEATVDGTLQERKAEIAYNLARTVIEEKRADWAKDGLNPNDSTWVRFAIQYLKDNDVSQDMVVALLSMIPGGSLFIKGLQYKNSIPRRRR